MQLSITLKKKLIFFNIIFNYQYNLIVLIHLIPDVKHKDPDFLWIDLRSGPAERVCYVRTM